MYSENLRREISWTVKLLQIHKIYIPQSYQMYVWYVTIRYACTIPCELLCTPIGEQVMML